MDGSKQKRKLIEAQGISGPSHFHGKLVQTVGPIMPVITKVDKFRVTGTQAITNQSGSQRELRKAIGFMVGATDQKEIEYSPKQADSISIDGQEVWNASRDRIYKVPEKMDQDPRNEWSDESLEKFRIADKSFREINERQIESTKDQSSIQAITKSLDNLNLDPIACAWNMISNNYKLFGNQVNFYLKISGPYTFVRLNRNGLKFSLEFVTSIFTYMDFNTGKSYELDERNEPRLILDHNSDAKSSIDPKYSQNKFILFSLETQEFLELVPTQNTTQFIDPRISEQGFALFDVKTNLFFMQYDGELIPILDPRKSENIPCIELVQKARPAAHVNGISPIAGLRVNIELDFTRSRLQDHAPQATIEISIQSSNKGFRYVGSQKAVEIIQLENIDHRSPLEFNQQALGFTVPDLTPLAPTLASITDANFKVGNLVSQIIPCFEAKKDQDLLNFILDLFNQATRVSLLRLQLSRIYRDKPEGDIIIDHGANLINAAFAEGVTVQDLLSKTNAELSIIFYKMKSAEFAKILNIFYSSGSNIPKAREAAVYIKKFPGAFLTGEYLTDEATVQRISGAVVMAIDTVRLVLDTIAKRKQFELLGYKTQGAFVSFRDVPKFFLEYLSLSIQDNSERNPLLNSELSVLAEKRMEAVDSNELDSGSGSSSQPNVEMGITQPLLQRDEVTVVRHSNLPPSIMRVTFQGGEPEKIAALWVRNPFIKAVNDGLGIHEMIKLFLTLYPKASQNAAPYLVITDVVGGLVGAGIGRHAILNPRDKMNTTIRTWEAGTDGLIVYIFSLNAAIRIYLTLHPDIESISNKLFWSQIASVPLFFSVSYASWHCIPPGAKEKIFGQNACLSYTKTVLDMTTKFLLYGGTFQYTNLRVLESPNTLAWELSPILPAFVMTALSRTRFKERAHGVMTYLASMNLIYTFGRSMAEILGPKEGSEELEQGNEISAYIRCGFWSILFVGSSYFVITNTLKFVEKYQGDPEVILQRTAVQDLERDGENLGDGDALDAEQYQSLVNPAAPGHDRDTTLTWLRQHHATRQNRERRTINHSTLREEDGQTRSWSSCSIL